MAKKKKWSPTMGDSPSTPEQLAPPSVSRSEKRQRAQRRKEFVLARMMEAPDKRLSFDDVNSETGRVSDTVLYRLAKELGVRGQPVVARHRQFIHSEPRRTTIERRTHERVAAKESIGKIAAKLVAPLHSERQSLWKSAEKEKPILTELWQKPHRLLFIDSGSTSLAAASWIVRTIRSHDADRELDELRILTNARLIWQAFTEAENPHEVIQLGGAERRDTGAVAGNLAEQCLEKWGLKGDLAMIGTTNLDDDMMFRCDHESEAAIKSRLLTGARIRCILCDSAKLMSPGRGSACKFSTLAQIDIVITDSEIRRSQTDYKLEERRQKFLQRAHDNKVVVLAEPNAVGDDLVVDPVAATAAVPGDPLVSK